jgi:hypothetical protein
MGALRDRLGLGGTPRRSDAGAQPPSAAAAFGTLPQPPGSAAVAAGSGGPGSPPAGEGPGSDLRRRRDALAEQVTELHWDLGGLAYEMAIRDHFRLDVLVRRAATLQERDAELAEVERLLRSEEQGAAGACPSCSAPHSRGAVYCWQCGTTLQQRLPSDSVAAQQTQTAVMDALLTPPGAADGEE